MTWFPVPRYQAIQRGGCRNCEGLTILRIQPAGLSHIFGLICCRCGTVTGMFDTYE